MMDEVMDVRLLYEPDGCDIMMYGYEGLGVISYGHHSTMISI